ncbi:MAG TPA: hypothetical protein VGO55_17305 [Allosphingosinicella sp.]|nr:hypothetical protein [Allosphingosinicella sp.]
MQASEAADSLGDPCQIDRLLEDGGLAVIVAGNPMVVEIVGFAPSMGDPQIPASIVDRILASQIPLRCRVVGPAGPGRSKAELHYLAWHDKSGDVWQPLEALPEAEGQTGNGAGGT